jgi:hypothetical protein
MTDTWLSACECCNLIDTTVIVHGHYRCSLCRVMCARKREYCSVALFVHSGEGGSLDDLSEKARKAEDDPQ